MKSLLLVLAIGISVCGCEGQQPPSPAVHTIANGAVSVRQLELGGNQEPRFEIVAAEAGWLRFYMGADRYRFGVPVSRPPAQYELRVVRQEYDGRTVLDQFVSPLFGQATAEQLEAQSGAVTDQKLVLTTFVLERPEEREIVEAGPIVTRVPAPGGSLLSSFVRSESTSDPSVRLAAWLYLPSGPLAAGIGPDTVVVELDGERVTAEEAGAVFEELRMEFSAEPLRAADGGARDAGPAL